MQTSTSLSSVCKWDIITKLEALGSENEIISSALAIFFCNSIGLYDWFLDMLKTDKISNI